MKTSWIAGLLIAGSLPLMAQNPNLGTAGATFLKLPTSAREAGLGQAAVSLMNGAEAVFVNPAGLASVKSVSVFAGYTPLWADVHVSHWAAAWNLGDWGVVGLSAIQLGMDDMEITTEFEQSGTGRYFGASDLMTGLSWARDWTDRFSVGGTVKLIHQKIWNESATAVAVDLGTVYHVGFRNMVIAMSMRHFGSDLKLEGSDLGKSGRPDPAGYPGSRQVDDYSTNGYPLPLFFQVGTSLRAWEMPGHLTVDVAAEVSHANDNDEMIYTGTEIGLHDFVTFRGGYVFNDPDRSWSLGGGLKFTYFGFGFRMDYAWSDHEYLEPVNRMGIGLDF